MRPGERLALVGESGSGKSTLALALMRLIRPPGRIAGGSIRLAGEDILQLEDGTMRRRRLSRIALIPQGAMNSLNPVMRIGDQIRDGMEDHGPVPKDVKGVISELLAAVGLDPDVARRFPHELSGGMKQRVAIAIGVSSKPAVIVADEPTSALDVVVQRQVIETLARVQSEIGASVVLVGHDMGLIAQFAEKIGVMYAGRLVEIGPVRDLLLAPNHPYTRLLVRSVPTLEARTRKADRHPRTPAVADQPPRRLRLPTALSRRTSDLRRVAARPHCPERRSASCLSYRRGRSVTPLLELQGVTKVFSTGIFNRQETVALDEVSFIVPDHPPRIIAIAGESGSGKTTLARMLLGMEKPTAGRALWRGKEMTRLSAASRRSLRRDVQPIFQDPFEAYNPFYRVDHVLTVPLQKLRPAASLADAHRMIRHAVEQVGLAPEEILGRYPHELSGGQRQRLMAARALLIRPRAILADEPVSMVDASLRATILESLRDLHRTYGISLIYVTHDLTTAFQIADAIVILYRGRIVEAGPVETVIAAPKHSYTRASRRIDSRG